MIMITIIIIIIIIFGVERFLALVVVACYITHYTIWLQSLMIIKVTFIYIGTTIMIVLLLLLLIIMMMIVMLVRMHQVRICCG